MRGRILRKEADTRLVLPRIGKLKIGMKNEKGKPQSVDYFIPTGKYAGLFTKAYGDKPSVIQIVFPDDDVTKVCSEYYEYRDDQGRLIAKGDGYAFEVWNGQKYVELTTDKRPDIMDLVRTKYPTKGSGWRVRMTLNFIVPLVRGVAGVWTFETNGNLSSIPAIRDIFDAMLAERGSCKGIIFDLSVQFAKSQKPGVSSRYPVVSLIPNESEENIKKLDLKLLKHGDNR